MKLSDISKSWTDRTIGAIRERLEQRESKALGRKTGSVKHIAEEGLQLLFELDLSDEFSKGSEQTLETIVSFINNLSRRILPDKGEIKVKYMSGYNQKKDYRDKESRKTKIYMTPSQYDFYLADEEIKKSA